MKIALSHFRVGETDGVSLEMDKWAIALEKLGHEVVYIAGSKGSTQRETYIIDELHYMGERNNRIVYNAYEELVDFTEAELKDEIQSMAKVIKQKLIKLITDEKIDILVPNNILSLGWGLPAGIGFTNAIRETGITTICHHHDFHWERVRYSNPTCSFISNYLLEYFPPKAENIKHCTINKIAQNQMLTRRGLKADVVPNVFDFEGELWIKDDYNSDLRKKIGIKDDDIFILQATRIVERKAIELAIDVVGKLRERKNNLIGKELYNGKLFNENSEIYLVLAGLDEGHGNYIEQLKKRAEEKGVILKFINNLIEHSREIINEEKIYSLWDAYVDCDFITYPSILEGWGNQYLEALFAKKPILVYEYPVYGTDIKACGFDVVSLGDTYTINSKNLCEVSSEIIENSANEMLDLLVNNSKREKIVESNYKIAYEKFSYSALKNILAEIFA